MNANIPTLTIAERTKQKRLFDAWLKFHSGNLHIYKLFEQFSRQALSAGHEKYSARAIFHRIRWETNVVTISTEEFKISNNHSPFYSRMLMDDLSEFNGFFRTKTGANNRFLDVWLINRKNRKPFDIFS